MDLGNHKKFKIAPDEAIYPCARHCDPLAKAEDAAEMLQLALENAGVGVWEYDYIAETLWLSPQSRRVFGLADDHSGIMTQEEWLRILDGGDVEKIQQLVHTSPSSTGSRLLEFRVQRANGEVRWLRVSACVLPDREGRPKRLTGLLFDDTDRKHAEDRVRASERHFRHVQEAARIGTFETDTNLRAVGSGQFYRNLGLPEDTEFLDNEPLTNLVHPDDRERVERETQAMLQSADHFDIECRIRTVDTGELRWILTRTVVERDDDGQMIRLVGAHLDITEAKRAEAALLESEERLDLIQDAVNIGIFVSEADQGIFGSRQFYRNLGLPEETVSIDINAHLDLVHPDDRVRLEQEGMAAIQSGADGVDTEYRIFRADTGELRWIFSRIKFERADDGQMIRLIGAHLDITETKCADAALHESIALNQSIIEASADCIKLVGLDGRLQFINEQGLAALEIEDGSRFLGRSWAELLPPKERPKIEAAIQAARNGQTGRFNAECPTATGKPTWWDVVVTPICDEQGQPRKLLAISREITQHRDHVAQIRWSASHDMLTELPNRRYFQDRLEKDIARAAASGSHVGLLQLDVDDFKQINDALGHDAGDDLLKTFSQRLLKATRGHEMAARLGGDEFAIIVPNLTDNRPLPRIVEDIQAQLAEPFVYQGRVFDCRASIGKAIYPQHGQTAEVLLKSSDIALYAAKASGRGNVRLFDPAMRTNMHKRLGMIDRAQTAMRDDRVFPYYQPKIHFGTGAPAGFEALLRWQDPKMRIQPPAAIAAAFEDLDVAQALSERMQLRVLADMRRWNDEGVDFGHVAINASAAEFRQNDFAERLLNRVKAAGVPTSQIEIEVTETVFLARGAEYVDRALNILSAEGVRIALDDFGTGYASLSHLKQFPVDVIKIDQSFVRNINIDPNDSAIIKALIELGKNLSIRIVAEGIENHVQSDFLAKLGCDYGQGYLFSKAVAAAKVPKLILRLKNGVTLKQHSARASVQGGDKTSHRNAGVVLSVAE